MMQWISVFQNNGLVNLMQLPFFREKTGALAIVEMGFMAGRQVGC